MHRHRVLRTLSFVAAVILVAAVLFGLAGCEKKSGSSEKQNAATFPDESVVEKRLEAKKKKAEKKAQESITSKNAEEVASELERKIESELEKE